MAPLELLPCSHLNYNHDLPKQGKGTTDHLMLLRLFCLFVRLSPPALSGLKTTLSGLKSILSGLRSALSSLKSALLGSGPKGVDDLCFRTYGDLHLLFLQASTGFLYRLKGVDDLCFWAAAPKGSMTYAFTHMGNFLLLLLLLLLLRPSPPQLKF